MDKLAHPLARGASWLLIYLTAVQPLHPAIATGITASWPHGPTNVRVNPCHGYHCREWQHSGRDETR